jgi:hypothetical protein
VLLVDARPHEIDDCDVVAWLTPGAEGMAEHETQRGFAHRFVRLLKASLFVEGEDLMGRSELLLGAFATKRSICAQSTVCGLSFFMRHRQVRPAYCAKRFQGRRPFDRAAIPVPSW